MSDLTNLCAACGLCCNGVLFFSAKLQPGDHERSLSALGLKIKTVEGERHALQPCPAHQAGSCTIYENRPVRCRLFECRQLQMVAAGERTPEDAMQTIEKAVAWQLEIKSLLEQAGETRTHKPLAVRCAGMFSEPQDPGPTATELRNKIKNSMAAYESFLSQEFRPTP